LHHPIEVEEEVTDQCSNLKDVKENFIFVGVIPARVGLLEKTTPPSASGAD